MKTLLGWNLIVMGINAIVWTFAYCFGEITGKDSVRSAVLIQFFMAVISAGSYLITGGN